MSTQIYNFKTALVTGGGGGIGKALSQQLIKDGKKVIIAGRTESNLKTAAKELGAAAYYVLDTGDTSSIPKFVEKLIAEHPDVDCLINNAGVQRPLDINKVEISEFTQKADQEIDINIRGPMHLALHMLPHLRSKSTALIVNVSSSLGFVPFSVMTPVYCGTKAWVHFWSVNLRQQLKDSNVRVVEIAPPMVGTDLHRDKEDPDDNKKEKNPVSLDVGEFIEEVVGKWKEGREMISAGPGNEVVQEWEQGMGKSNVCDDSASEDDMTHDELSALEPTTQAKPAGRKSRTTPAQTKTSAPATKAAAKGRPVARRVSGGSTMGVKKSSKKAPAKSGRKAVAARTNGNASDTEEVDEFDEIQDAAPVEAPKPAKRGRPAKTKKAPEEVEDEEEVADEPAPAKKTRKAPAKETKAKTVTKSKATKRAPVHEPEPETFTIPETQPEPDPDPMDLSESIEVDDMDEIPESMPPPPRPSARRTQPQPSRPRQPSTGPRRAGSASDSERDPALRRKVGDLNKKLEAMTVKYEALRDAATSGRESNFDQLKKRTDQTAKDQDTVIKALRSQLSDLHSRTADLTAMKQQIASLTKETTRLDADNKKLSSALTTAHSESKALSHKLAAARQPTDSSSKPAVPGSAMKPRSTGVVLPGTVEAAKEAQLAKQKVDLYSDLTNLVVLGMRRNDDDEDVYDCLQTGRNGTLHFHLSVAPQDSSSSYEDTEFVYQPLLDEQRDRELLDLLPDYLTEEICFPRGQAAKFYAKVVDCMGRRIVLEDD
ncbi:hypothetical protein P153DRAFT_426193 [Dothidotthia symphoricarpi CBS 119687]|uniref:Monopolin complex subunit Csm1/Pcs1 C-terminal domain-containing protein n=1 Tax=Dothidotthia symphoricarpi CBS 119687 TaxID=1392245 RepID=A0A6A6A1Z5_9PLEO|nr:uncharacterized protein P153DRAFT_426193 [Dothidotthia symphoricarpi CBS 119687]KAF2125225.1 hypothetical protein P153DRAFT_426193 [Dothidotthia symphoricarpi CBS 119687]